MKSLKKLSLSVAISMAPFAAHALEALDDDFLGDVTGQEGITIDTIHKNTIEEFKYIDGDGDGSGTAGEISIKDIRIGNFASPSDSVLGNIHDGNTNSAGANLGMISDIGKRIDATENGVLLTNGNVGTEARVLVNEDLNVIAAFNPTYTTAGGALHSMDSTADWNNPAAWTDLGSGGVVNLSAAVTDAQGIIHANVNASGAVTAATGGAVPLGTAVYKTLEASINLQSQAAAKATATSAYGYSGTTEAEEIGYLTALKSGTPAQQFLASQLDPDGDDHFGYDETADTLLDNAEVLRSYGDGKDTYIGGIEIGNANGQQNSIGSFMILNQSNFLGSARVLRMTQRWGINQDKILEMMNNNANQWKRGNILISSKTSGTGVHIVQESGGGAQVMAYTDTDTSSGNQIGVIGMSTFRLADVDHYDNAGTEDGDALNGTYLRGARSEFDIDVEDGKLVIGNQVKDSSTIFNKIFIGNVADAQNAANPTGIIGGIAILGNHWEGTTKIYSH